MQKSKNCSTESLYQSHKEPLLKMIRSRVSDSQKAEDILHDSFEKMENCCSQGCHCEQPKSYLYKIVWNSIMDFLSKLKRERKELEAPVVPDLLHDQTKFESGNCDLLGCLYKFIQELPNEQRKAFVEVELHRKSQVELSRELDIALPTIKSRVQRSRKTLRKKLEACCPDYREKCF